VTPYERGQASARAGEPGPPFPKPNTAWSDRLFARGWSDEMDKIRKEKTVKLDPVREARVRRMVLFPGTWPGACLHMKRLAEPMMFGVIYPEGIQPGRICISASPGENRVAVYFDSLEALIEAGWAVD
jgi:hypothetical protein